MKAGVILLISGIAIAPAMVVGFLAATANYELLQGASKVSLLAAAAWSVVLLAAFVPKLPCGELVRSFIVVLSGVGIMVAMSVALGLSNRVPGSLRWVDQCTLEWRNGGFTAHTHQQIESFTNKSNAANITLVVRDNAGGRLADARLLALYLGSNRIGHVHVEGHCTSACTTFFLSAPSRSMAEGAELKFHGVYNSVSKGFDPKGFARYRDHAHENGISMKLLGEAAKIPYGGPFIGETLGQATACGDGESCIVMRPMPVGCSTSLTDNEDL